MPTTPVNTDYPFSSQVSREDIQRVVLVDLSTGDPLTFRFGYPTVSTYADLPLASAQAGNIYIVLTATSSMYIFNRKSAGMYYSNGSSWEYLGDMPTAFSSSIFRIYDGSSNSKQLSFDVSGISALTTRQVTFPNYDIDLGAITSAMLAGGISYSKLSVSGSIQNSDLVNSSITINGSSVSLGGSTTITASVTNALTVDNASIQLNTGTTFDGSAARTISIKDLGVTNAMLAGSISYSKLSLGGSILNTDLVNSSITINGTSIALGASGTVTAAAGTLTGSTLNSSVTGSSLTSVGTIGTGTWQGTLISPTYGGTGVNNGSFLLTVPATGTAALLARDQTFSGVNNFSGLVGIGSTTPVASLDITENVTSSAWTTNGIGLRIRANTYTDNSSSGTVSNIALHSILGSTLNTSNSVTATSFTNLYVAAPVAGTNLTTTAAGTFAGIFAGNIGFQAGATVRFGTIDNNALTIQTNGSTRITLNTNGTQVHTHGIQNSGAGTWITYNQPAHSGGSHSGLLWTAGASSSQTASTEVTDQNWNNSATLTFNAGALATNRTVRFQGRTLAFASASTVTDAVNVEIDSPVAGTNATITNNIALRMNGDIFLNTSGSNTRSIKTYISTGTTVGTLVAMNPTTNTFVFGNAASNGQLNSAGWSFVTSGNIQFRNNSGTGISQYFGGTGNWVFGASTDNGGKVQVLSTTEQVRVQYDASNYFSTTVGSAGSTTFALTGTSPTFTFSQAVSVTGNVTGTTLIGGYQANATATSSHLAVAPGSGGTTLSAATLQLFSANVQARMYSRGSNTMSPAAGLSSASYIMGTQSTTIAATGTHSLFAQLAIKPLTIVAGAGTLTNSASLYLEGAATGATNNYTFWSAAGLNRFGGNVSLDDAANLVLGTTTGTKIGTATNQLLGFWNVTPIVQPTTAIAAATLVGGGGTTITDTDTFDGYTLKQIVKALRNAGLLA